MYRTGDTMHLRVKIVLGGAPTAASLTVTLPLSLTIGSSAVWAVTGNKTLGRVSGFDNTGDTYSGMVNYASSTTIGVFVDYAAATWAVQGNPMTDTSPVTWAINDVIYIHAEIPITEWA